MIKKREEFKLVSGGGENRMKITSYPKPNIIIQKYLFFFLSQNQKETKRQRNKNTKNQLSICQISKKQQLTSSVRMNFPGEIMSWT